MDYRDPWTQNPHKRAALSKRIREEARLLAGSAAVTIVSQSWAKTLDRQYSLGSKLHVITNGYDPEGLADIEPRKFDHFAIVYAGRFYPPKRVITPVMQTLRFLKQNYSTSTDHFFHYYGPHQEHVRVEAERYGVSDCIMLHGDVAQSVALSALRGANVAVVITSVSENSVPEEQGIVTGKIFEPIGLKTPILLISPPGGDAEIVVRVAGVGEAFRGNDVKGMAAFLHKLMSGNGRRPESRSEYSWANVAKHLDQVLRKVFEDDRIDKGGKPK
jgi:glycosyltransferase involved in cell wall biosynthesis